MRAYRDKLKAGGRFIEARAVGQCIKFAQQDANKDAQKLTIVVK